MEKLFVLGLAQFVFANTDIGRHWSISFLPWHFSIVGIDEPTLCECLSSAPYCKIGQQEKTMVSCGSHGSEELLPVPTYLYSQLWWGTDILAEF